MNTEQERTNFEAFMEERHPNVSLKRFETGCYLVSETRHRWEGWKARAAIEADRQRGREPAGMPSGAEIWQFTYDFNKGAFRDSDDVIDYARALLSRYGKEPK